MRFEHLTQAEFERAIAGFDVEVGTAYRPDDKQAFPPVIGERDRVPFPRPSEIDLSGTTFVHNHTEVRRISNGDLFEAARHRAKGVVAILPGGTALRLVLPNPADWPIEELIGRQDAIKDEAGERFGDGLELGERLDEKHRWMIKEQVRAFAEVGVIMRVEPPADD